MTGPRLRAIVLALLAATSLAACAVQEPRPEGIVERWLQSLDQGSAGTPIDFAEVAATDSVLPDHAQRDPGDIDLIEVGAATEAGVPFRIVLLSGDEIRGTATLQERDGELRVVAVDRDVALGLPSEGGDRPGSSATSTYVIALALAALLIAASGGVLTLVRRSATPRT